MARRVLKITGGDRVGFLQGLVSNDVSQPEALTYAALLNAQGKFIVDFFVLTAGEYILVDVDADHAEGLLKKLTLYKLRAQVDVALTDLTVSRGLSPRPEGAYEDPRHPDLGWRGYAGQPSEEVDWDALYVQHVIPRIDRELTSDTYLLEAGFERLNGVDFKKGCYVGQEVTARMKHKTELRKGLVRVDISAHVPMGSAILSEDGKDVGRLYSQSGGQAIAYLRFDRAKGPMSCAGATVTWDGQRP